MHHYFSLACTKRLCLVAGVTTALFSVGALQAQTWVIIDQAHPVTGTADRQILLDAATHIEAELSADLPADPARATALVQQRLTHGDVELQRQIGATYQGVADAWSLGITKIPAVIVDQSYVVYGEPDVVRSVALIEAHRRAKP
ncbi:MULTISPECIES: TIGR03757 family integrating conjugative element protein [Pseudomonadota]|uniref:TIGR03757 family integrating conjugative element protein n=1 Tax=Pseudomonadota TaxID=1224 RepID=UPI0003D67024|nr:TIGR03757 family integrating conjugative element protein [Achromobacter xylosoxidans]HBO0525153.1 TIGR03757 family integrating conjugative element protein [Pseudomonas aeruginosa]HBY2266936.1 TIGR03757 family integrating conjugative element protein [Klebsiella pneumoniae]AHC45633.1 hypothetical protein AX27061_1168 [Achromobacter xylosoxidans NBRC 15126 = ATCC 27061]QKQ55904.1 TIGR03757 family integrating conjugative element protein [Achromobacter xylosoxidans]QPR94938.1 TIGR03757 family in